MRSKKLQPFHHAMWGCDGRVQTLQQIFVEAGSRTQSPLSRLPLPAFHQILKHGALRRM
jgi:hypothetical protein